MPILSEDYMIGALQLQMHTKMPDAQLLILSVPKERKKLFLQEILQSHLILWPTVMDLKMFMKKMRLLFL